MADFIRPSSFRCDCGYAMEFVEETIQQMHDLSLKRTKPLTLRVPSGHRIEFQRGSPVAIICPQNGVCDVHSR